MLFKRKFFLDLEAEAGKTPAPPAVVAPVEAKPAKALKPRMAGAATGTAAEPAPPAVEAKPAKAMKPRMAGASEVQAAPDAAPPSPALTTAEAIAAELAAEQANRPAPTQATFAPECLTPGANPPRRRRAGADLARFRAMAGGMLRS